AAAGFYDDVAEFLFGLKPALHVEDVRELGAGQRRLATDATRGDLGVLFAHGVQYVVDAHAALGDLAGVEPQAHRVVAGAEQAHVARTGQAREYVSHLNDGVVAQVKRVVATVVRGQEHDHRQVRRTLLGDETDLPHL